MFNKHWPMLGLAAVIFTAAVGLRLAEGEGLLDGDAGTRTFMTATGLLVAAMGNGVPKRLKRLRATPEAERRVQAALRRVGWTMTLAGLVFAGLWLAAPEATAEPISLAALGLALAVAVFSIFACRTGAAGTPASGH